jgi:hypothetical protein
VPALADGGKGSRCAQKGSTGVKADIPIGVEVAEREGNPAGWKKRFNPVIREDGEVVWDRGIGSFSGGAAKSVMSLRGAFFGVIFNVARGFVGELIDSFRARVMADSFSDREREWDGVRLRWGRSA